MYPSLLTFHSWSLHLLTHLHSRHILSCSFNRNYKIGSWGLKLDNITARLLDHSQVPSKTPIKRSDNAPSAKRSTCKSHMNKILVEWDMNRTIKRIKSLCFSYAKYGEGALMVLVGRRLRRWVAWWRASTQKRGGKLAWNNRERTMSLTVCITRSALPFCWEVYGHEKRMCMRVWRRGSGVWHYRTHNRCHTVWMQEAN
jgi:hypothetical protein